MLSTCPEPADQFLERDDLVEGDAAQPLVTPAYHSLNWAKLFERDDNLGADVERLVDLDLNAALRDVAGVEWVDVGAETQGDEAIVYEPRETWTPAILEIGVLSKKVLDVDQLVEGNADV